MTDAAADGVTRLVLVRHGESRAMVDAIVGGHEGCKGLSPLGVRQAEALRERLSRTGEIKADVLLASVLPRAIETAEIIAPSLGGLSPDQHCDLCEIHPGEADGLTWDEFRVRYMAEGRTWDAHTPVAPGSETSAEFQSRVARTLTRLVDEHRGRTVVAVCHGGVVDASLIGFLGLPFHGALFSPRTETTSITEWELDASEPVDGRPRRWRLIRYNDAAHLRLFLAPD